MTFDEAIGCFHKSCEYGNPQEKTFNSEQVQVAIAIVEELRKEYAPEIEMTETEYEIFLSCHIRDDSASWLDAVIWERVDYNYPKFFQSWLHPELIKVMDE